MVPSYFGKLLGPLAACCLTIPLKVDGANTDDLELGRQLLYCGVVTMKVIEWTGLQNPDREAVERRSKAAYGRMLVQTSLLIPQGQLNSEYRTAQDRLADELKTKAAERATNPAAVGAFLRDQYVSCQKLESEKGKEAFVRGMEAMGKPAASSPKP